MYIIYRLSCMKLSMQFFLKLFVIGIKIKFTLLLYYRRLKVNTSRHYNVRESDYSAINCAKLNKNSTIHRLRFT